MKKFLTVLALIAFMVVECSAQLSSARRKYLDIIVSPDHSDWNYETGETPVLNVTAYKNGALQKGAKVYFEYGPELMNEQKKDSAIIGDGGARIKLPTMKKPGFMMCSVKAVVRDGNNPKEAMSVADNIKLGFSAAKIKPTVEMPSDFDKFWASCLEDVAKTPLDLTKKLNTQYSTGKVLVYEVSYRVSKAGHRMNGWLMVPNKEGKFAAVLVPPGAGVKKQTPSLQYAERDMICLQTEIHGLPLDLRPEDYAGAGKAIGDYWLTNLDNTKSYYYNHVYIGCKRGIDVLLSLEESNGNVATTGGSQGGALAIVTAYLDKRVKGVAAFYPALCDVTGYLHGRAGGWPHMFKPTAPEENKTKDRISNIRYYDVVNFARKLNVPVYFSFGYNDSTCPPTTLYACYNSIVAQKQLHIDQASGHWRFPERNEQSMDWIMQIVM